MSSVAPILPIYYDSQRKEYLRRNPNGRWQGFGIREITERLVSNGLSLNPVSKDNPLNECHMMRQRITDENDVVYSGSLAGHNEGFYEKNGIRYLVTDSPTLIDPQKGDWHTILPLLLNMFGEKQCTVFLSWLKIAAESLRSGNWTQQQALAIAGEVACGKSFVQNYIITPCLGGRSAKAARYMLGKTQFNSDLFESEHLVMDDEFVSHKIADRLALGASIKKMTVSTESESLHGKGRKAVPMSPFWRLTFTLNDNPEALQVLPILNEDIADKIIILKASKHDFLMPTNTLEQKGLFLSAIRSELPAFLYHLLNDFRIPDDMVDSRYGVASYQNPEIIEALDEIAPETTLLRLIDSLLQNKETKIEAIELRDRLYNNPETSFEAKRLLDGWDGKTALYLGRLAKKHPERFICPTNNKNRKWVIKPDNKKEEDGLTEILNAM